MSGPNRPSSRSSPRRLPISSFSSRVRATFASTIFTPCEVHGLGQVVGGAAAQGLHRGLHAGVPGDEDDVGRPGLRLLEQVEPAPVGELDIDEQDVRGAPRQLRFRFPDTAGRRRREPFASHELRKPLEKIHVVVDDQRVKHRQPFWVASAGAGRLPGPGPGGQFVEYTRRLGVGRRALSFILVAKSASFPTSRPPVHAWHMPCSGPRLVCRVRCGLVKRSKPCCGRSSCCSS